MEPLHAHHSPVLVDRHRGFTYVELLVVFGIIITISAVVFTSQSNFNKVIILANTAYDIALTIRSAETYGLGGRATNAAANVGYGVHFDTSNSRQYKLFADTYPSLPSSGAFTGCHAIADTTTLDAQPGNCAYNFTQESSSATTYTLGNGFTISDFCAYFGNAGGQWKCAYWGSEHIGSLDIVFARPNPNPFMAAETLYSTSNPVLEACIKLSSAQGDASRFIRIERSGLINANAPADLASCQ